MNRLAFITVIIFSTLTSCVNYGQLKIITDLPGSLKENSGFVTYGDSTVWAIEDSGNKNDIYQVNFKGDIIKTTTLVKIWSSIN